MRRDLSSHLMATDLMHKCFWGAAVNVPAQISGGTRTLLCRGCRGNYAGGAGHSKRDPRRCLNCFVCVPVSMCFFLHAGDEHTNVYTCVCSSVGPYSLSFFLLIMRSFSPFFFSTCSLLPLPPQPHGLGTRAQRLCRILFFQNVGGIVQGALCGKKGRVCGTVSASPPAPRSCEVVCVVPCQSHLHCACPEFFLHVTKSPEGVRGFSGAGTFLAARSLPKSSSWAGFHHFPWWPSFPPLLLEQVVCHPPWTTLLRLSLHVRGKCQLQYGKHLHRLVDLHDLHHPPVVGLDLAPVLDHHRLWTPLPFCVSLLFLWHAIIIAEVNGWMVISEVMLSVSSSSALEVHLPGRTSKTGYPTPSKVNVFWRFAARSLSACKVRWDCRGSWIHSRPCIMTAAATLHWRKISPRMSIETVMEMRELHHLPPHPLGGQLPPALASNHGPGPLPLLERGLGRQGNELPR
mgnify:CR=1 FL=1